MSRLKQLRMEKGVMSQRQLVIALEKYYGKPVCTAATISKIENKPDYNPTLKTLRSISEFFDVSIAYLMGESLDRHGMKVKKPSSISRTDRMVDLIHRQLILERYELHHFSAYDEWRNRSYIPNDFDEANLDLMIEKGYEKLVLEYRFFFPHEEEDDERYNRLDEAKRKLKRMIMELDDGKNPGFNDFISGENPSKFFHLKQTDNQTK